ncbi:MAG: hypothetical protein KC731_10660, partial [Myxococcales bacterium]|nr:hypothetical protein [Myxococcales bacterium]
MSRIAALLMALSALSAGAACNAVLGIEEGILRGGAGGDGGSGAATSSGGHDGGGGMGTGDGGGLGGG